MTAGNFVLAAWTLFALAVAGALTIGVSAVISAFYHPHSRWAPLYDRIGELFWAYLIVGLIVAVASSVAIWFSRRIAASATVAIGWSLLLVGSVVALAAVEPGPEFFVRYVGEERFRLPWQYAPRGLAAPNASGFSARFCPDTMKGTYGEVCRKSEQLSVRPREYGFASSFDLKYWRSNLSEMQRGEARHGHEAYTFADAANPGRTGSYFVLRDGRGELLRFVRCYRSGTCRHIVALDANYTVHYDAGEHLFARWGDVDREVEQLVMSWRERASMPN